MEITEKIRKVVDSHVLMRLARECKKFCVNGFSMFNFGKTIAGSYSPEG